jgi:hypothetical protein
MDAGEIRGNRIFTAAKERSINRDLSYARSRVTSPKAPSTKLEIPNKFKAPKKQ